MSYLEDEGEKEKNYVWWTVNGLVDYFSCAVYVAKFNVCLVPQAVLKQIRLGTDLVSMVIK